MIEKYLSGFFLLLSVSYLFFASDISFGMLAKPKAGFLPNIIGVLAVILSAINFYQTIRKDIEPNSENSMDKFTAKNIGLVIVGMFVYIIALGYVGYIIATTLFLFYLLKVTRLKGVVKPAFISLSVVGAFYFCFVVLLEVPLP